MTMYDEIMEIPEAANRCYAQNRNVSLPIQVPYLGMGSSYFAPLVMYYSGIPILPFIASEYFLYLAKNRKDTKAVLISQSGESSETLWCSELFESYIALTNDPAGALARGKNAGATYLLQAGKEIYSATKSYINTLILLYLGLGKDIEPALIELSRRMQEYEEQGRNMAEKIHATLEGMTFKTAYILGNGPNIGTALEAALILSETTKIPFTGMPLAQYDHGPKETAKDSIVIAINAKGKARQRTAQLLKIVQNAGAMTFTIDEPTLPESLSPLTTIIPLNFLAWFLARKRGVSTTFEVGNKVTRVKDHE